MPEGLEIFLKDWGPGGLVAAFVLAMIFGRLEAKSSVDEKVKLLKESRDEALEREHYYRDANQKLQDIVALQAQQLKELMAHAETTVAILESLESGARDTWRGSSATSRTSPGPRAIESSATDG